MDQDPEPWRCWRSDGKKWRCSKKAHPESKYCEFHMHRGCKRPKKQMEVDPLAQSPCASVVTSLARSGSGGSSFQSISLNPLAGSGNAAGSFPSGTTFQSISLNPLVGSSNAAGSFPGGTGSSRQSLCPDSYGIAGTELRYPYGMKGDLNEHSLVSKASGNARGLGIDSSLDASWRLMPTQMSLFPLFKARNNSSLQSSNLQFPALQDPWQASVSSLSKPEQQHSFFNSEFGSAKPANHEIQSFQPFINEWPRTMDMWSGLEDERTNQNFFSTTQLSVSMPMTSPGFSTTNSKSPNDG